MNASGACDAHLGSIRRAQNNLEPGCRLQSHFVPGKIGSLVNIDHRRLYLIFQLFAGTKEEGSCEGSKATVRSPGFSCQSRDRKNNSEIPQGRTIYAQGEEADRIFYIQSGAVKVTVVSEQGKEAVVGILDAAQFFGEGCLNGQAVRVGTARAMEESLITSITRKAMMGALRKEPKLSELFVTYLVTRSNRIEEDLIDQLFNSSEKRLAPSSSAGQFRKKWKANPNRCFDQSSNLGRDDWNDPIPGELFSEQVSQAGIDQLQRKIGSAPFLAERCVVRKTSVRTRRKANRVRSNGRTREWAPSLPKLADFVAKVGCGGSGRSVFR